MLGVRREGVTEAACNLHSQGVIEYRRGHINVLSRPRLEQLSCECYATARKEADRLLPGAIGRAGRPLALDMGHGRRSAAVGIA